MEDAFTLRLQQGRLDTFRCLVLMRVRAGVAQLGWAVVVAQKDMVVKAVPAEGYPYSLLCSSNLYSAATTTGG